MRLCGVGARSARKIEPSAEVDEGVGVADVAAVDAEAARIPAGASEGGGERGFVARPFLDADAVEAPADAGEVDVELDAFGFDEFLVAGGWIGREVVHPRENVGIEGWEDVFMDEEVLDEDADGDFAGVGEDFGGTRVGLEAGVGVSCDARDGGGDRDVEGWRRGIEYDAGVIGAFDQSEGKGRAVADFGEQHLADIGELALAVEGFGVLQRGLRGGD